MDNRQPNFYYGSRYSSFDRISCSSKKGIRDGGAECVICVPPPDKFGERNGDAGIGKKKLIGKMIRNKKKKEKERSSSYLHTVTAKMLSLYYLSLLSSILVSGLVLKDIRKKKKKKIGALYAPVARPTNCLSL